MSETQVLAPTLISEIKKIDECAEPDVQLVATATSGAAALNEEDLEDGEIDDDDDDDDCGGNGKHNDNDVIEVPVRRTTTVNSGAQAKDKSTSNAKLKITPESVVTIELSDDNGPPPTSLAAKSKKPKPIEDDHLSSIEHALAKALKKKGIEPVAPVLVTHTIDDHDEHQSGCSRSSRRRKRKKQREEKEKSSKSHSEKKKSRYESPEPTQSIDVDLDEMDDFEMLNVRGGSPPPGGHMPMQMMSSNYKEQPQSDYESDYSYDSYDSQNDGDSPRNESRRRRRNKKDKKRRDRGGRNEKRHRRDTPERQEPRKLELCKFYLLECCAKRDKCSYMHGDFPCKYYYLGMDCAEKDDCKFSHGEPLTEQLRNILIKHLEMAPKEILGNFKRIPREQAISQITKRHVELCKEYGVENSWSNLTSPPSNFSRQGKQQQKQQKQKQQQQQHQQQQLQQLQQLQQQQLAHQKQQQQQSASKLSNIPSLLDMVIKPPNELTNLVGGNSPSHDRQRKSRWNDNNSSMNDNHRNTAAEQLSSASVGPSYLDIKNLKGILSDEHLSALSSLGIVNLEQVNQLTVGQLNQISLTIAEINEIQLNAKNMAKMGSLNSTGATAAESTVKNSPKTEMSSSQTASIEPANVEKKTTVQKLQESEIFSTNSNSSSNSAIRMVDYSQYLKEAHLAYDRNDDDERDDEQLIIDDGNTENDESPFGASPSKSETQKKRKDSQSDSEQHQHHRVSMSTLQMSDFGTALRNPFSAAMNQYNKSGQDPRMRQASFERTDVAQKKSTATADTDSDDERYYASRGRRSRSVTPPPHSGSSTPEASQSPRLESFGSGATVAKPKPRENPKYERQTMYDFDIQRAAQEDEARAAKTVKADKDMRFLEGANVGGDIDLRLPFLPVTNYTPATEIDASITSHLPMTYKVHEVDVKPACYVELRLNSKSEQTSDPRLRRILGLSETSQTRTAAAVLNRNVRKLSNTIASPESSDGASPKYYTPPVSGSEERERERSHRSSSQKRVEEAAAPVATTKPATQPLRLDPRRAARQNAEPPLNSPPIPAAAAATAQPNNAVKQNVEIRNNLQKSEWYKNLNSKFKIMVNQQLALVSTELKKFHQDPSPNKIFDISFIVNNTTLQQILTQLGIFIDDNGEVSHIEGDDDAAEVQLSSQEITNNSSNNANIMLPNLSQPPPLQQQQQQQQQQLQQQQQQQLQQPMLDFLRGPPPNMLPNQGLNLQQFSAPPPNVRPSLLGPPPAAPPRNPFNPFAQSIPINPFVGGPSLLGPGPGPNVPPIAFNNFNALPNMQQQRNFGSNNGSQQRNQRNQRRNNK